MKRAWLAAGLLVTATGLTNAATVDVANFRNDFVAGTTARSASVAGDTSGFDDLNNGWAYLWNAPTGWVADDFEATNGTGGNRGDLSTGDIGTVANYKPLVWATNPNRWTPDGDSGTSASGLNNYNNSLPAGYLQIGDGMGHPGRGPELTNNVERFVIVAYEIQQSDGAGSYAITSSSITRGSSNGDGDRIYIHVESDAAVLDEIIPPDTDAADNYSFDVNLGHLDVGDRIYVAIGTNQHPSHDGFGEFDFTVTAIPEPASLGLLAIGVLPLLRRRR